METMIFVGMGPVLRVILAVAVSFFVTFAASKILIPVLKRKKAEQHVRDDGPQTHLVKQGTPTMGGIMMLIGIVVAAAAFFYWLGGAKIAGYLLMATLLFSMIGFADDSIKLFKKRSLGLRAWQKIVFQLGASAAVACYSFFVLGNSFEVAPFSHYIWELGGWQIPFTMFVFISMVNSVNLTDGLDGLATSLTLTNAIAFLVILLAALLAVPNASRLDEASTANIAVFAAALAGACIAFLIFNKHPAQVFMGDTGSFALGAAITAIASALRMQLLLPIMGLMFVLSAISVIIQVGSFKLRGKRVFRMAPLHHHFELKPMPETKVLRGYVLVTIALSAVGVLGYAI